MQFCLRLPLRFTLINTALQWPAVQHFFSKKSIEREKVVCSFILPQRRHIVPVLEVRPQGKERLRAGVTEVEEHLIKDRGMMYRGLSPRPPFEWSGTLENFSLLFKGAARERSLLIKYKRAEHSGLFSVTSSICNLQTEIFNYLFPGSKP